MDITLTHIIRTLYAPMRTLEYTIRNDMRTLTQNTFNMRMLITSKELIYRKKRLTLPIKLGNQLTTTLQKIEPACKQTYT